MVADANNNEGALYSFAKPSCLSRKSGKFLWVFWFYGVVGTVTPSNPNVLTFLVDLAIVFVWELVAQIRRDTA